jgi:hypothetical protein
MYSTVIQVINESLFPLVSYLPVIGITGVFAWIVATQFYMRRVPDQEKRPSDSKIPSNLNTDTKGL